MKTKYHFLILGLTTILFNLNAQISNKDALTKTWFVDVESTKAGFNNNNEHLSADEFTHLLWLLSDYEVSYFANNTFSYTLMGTKANGSWQINNNKLTSDTGDSLSEYEIIKLNENSLILKDNLGVTYHYVTDKNKTKLNTKDIFHRVDE